MFFSTSNAYTHFRFTHIMSIYACHILTWDMFKTENDSDVMLQYCYSLTVCLGLLSSYFASCVTCFMLSRHMSSPVPNCLLIIMSIYISYIYFIHIASSFTKSLSFFLSVLWVLSLIWCFQFFLLLCHVSSSRDFSPAMFYVFCY